MTVPQGMINAYSAILKYNRRVSKSTLYDGSWVYVYDMPGYDSGNIMRQVGRYTDDEQPIDQGV